ncbi:MAG: hypothetical protein QM737_03090 [Ferruginibacter sp.]
MKYQNKTANIFFKFSAILFLAAAGYHFTGIFYKVNDAPVWRHILFTVINLFCIYGVLKRPKYFVYFIIALLVQQYYSHGTYMISLWNDKKQIHWISFFDLIFLPVLLFFIIKEHKNRKSITAEG